MKLYLLFLGSFDEYEPIIADDLYGVYTSEENRQKAEDRYLGSQNYET